MKEEVQYYFRGRGSSYDYKDRDLRLIRTQYDAGFREGCVKKALDSQCVHSSSPDALDLDDIVQTFVTIKYMGGGNDKSCVTELVRVSRKEGTYSLCGYLSLTAMAQSHSTLSSFTGLSHSLTMVLTPVFPSSHINPNLPRQIKNEMLLIKAMEIN